MFTISKVIAIYDKSKDGQIFRTKKGDPYRKATVNFAETGDKAIGIFVWNNETCDVGDEYEGTIESREWEGKTYYSLTGKKKEDKYMKKIAELEFSLARAHDLIQNVVDHLKKEPWKTAPVLPKEIQNRVVEAQSQDNQPEINPDDIPF